MKPVKVDGKVTMHLCFRCAGIYFETGERPPAYRMRDPVNGPITGKPIRLTR